MSMITGPLCDGCRQLLKLADEQRATIERMTQAYAVLHARLAELTAEPPHDNRAEHADRLEGLKASEPLDVMDYSRGIPHNGEVW